MNAPVVRVKNAERMMTYARAVPEGIELEFADGQKGVVPFADIPEVRELSNLAGIELPNPYEVVLRTPRGEQVELPWDFARHYCDPSYRARMEARAQEGSQSLGRRIRRLRETARMTQEELAAQARIGRVTLVRIEQGDQSPRYKTLEALASALGRPLVDLLVDEAT